MKLSFFSTVFLLLTVTYVELFSNSNWTLLRLIRKPLLMLYALRVLCGDSADFGIKIKTDTQITIVEPFLKYP